MSDAYPPGIDVEILGRSIPIGTGQAALLVRARYAPGSHIPPHTDPGTGVWVVERGTIGFTVLQGEAQITRAGTSTVERIDSSSGEIILNPGDTASCGPDNVHTSRNAGEQEASILIGGVYETEGSLVRPVGARSSA